MAVIATEHLPAGIDERPRVVRAAPSPLTLEEKRLLVADAMRVRRADVGPQHRLLAQTGAALVALILFAGIVAKLWSGS